MTSPSRSVGAQPVEHRRAGVDAGDVEARGGERDGQPSGADAELEHRGRAAGERAAATSRDRGVDVATPAVPVVVHVGEGVAVRRWSVAHPPASRRSGRPISVGRSVDRAVLVYLDHAATTPMRPEAIEAMLPFLAERFANPSGSHRFARDARRAVDEARDASPTSSAAGRARSCSPACGTESDNAAIVGACGAAAARRCARRPSTTPCSTSSSATAARVVAVDAPRPRRSRRARRRARRRRRRSSS